jgi:hypothetical protein
VHDLSVYLWCNRNRGGQAMTVEEALEVALWAAPGADEVCQALQVLAKHATELEDAVKQLSDRVVYLSGQDTINRYGAVLDKLGDS